MVLIVTHLLVMGKYQENRNILCLLPGVPYSEIITVIFSCEVKHRTYQSTLKATWQIPEDYETPCYSGYLLRTTFFKGVITSHQSFSSIYAISRKYLKHFMYLQVKQRTA